MSFEQYVTTVKDAAAANLPVAVGGAVAVIVLLFLGINSLARRRAGNEPFTLPEAAGTTGPTGKPADEKALNWAPPEQSYADRRGAVRRDGPPVRVVLSSPTFRNGVADGFVTDRSTGGLRLAVPTAVAPGSTLGVRAVNAPDTIGFVSVIIRSCRKNGDHFEVGCEFEKTPPWNVLLLFG
jgi:hypothetical protein